MRSRSITWPLILVAIGIFFLINNVRPDLVDFSRIGDYWPFLLIAVGVIGLVEVLFRASRGVAPPPRPFGGAGIFWIVMLCILVSVADHHRDFRFASFDTDRISFFGSNYDYDVNASQPAAGVTRIVLDNIRGDLSLKGGDDSAEVKVTGRKRIQAFNRTAADRAESQATVRVERQGDEIVIRTDSSNQGRDLRMSADLDISVPKGVSIESRGGRGELNVDDIDGTVTVSGGRGDVRLTRVGQDVHIDSARNGDVHATDVKGTFDLQGHGGDVSLVNIAGSVTVRGEYSGTLEFRNLAQTFQFNSTRTEFHAAAVPGEIVMDLGDLKMTNVAGPVRFQSGTRDITATDITNALDLVIDRGDIEITSTKTPLPKMDVHSHNGDIELTVPERAGFQLNGTTARGDVDNDFGAPLQTHSSGHSASILGQTGTGPQINIETDRGTVSIKKS